MTRFSIVVNYEEVAEEQSCIFMMVQINPLLQNSPYRRQVRFSPNFKYFYAEHLALKI